MHKKVYHAMTSFDKQKLTETVLYILNKTQGLDYYHLFKVIYFANASHLAKYGFAMVNDEFCALPDGPVPSNLYNSIKGVSYCDKELENRLDESVTKGAEDAYYMLAAKREADKDYLSHSEIEVLDEAISKYANLSYSELRKRSHGREWRRAFEGKGRKVMDVIGMARDNHASEDIIEYIKDNLAVESALS